MKTLIICLLLVLSPIIIIGQQFERNAVLTNYNYHPPTNADDLQILFEYPPNYIKIGIIDVSKSINLSKKKSKRKATKKAKKVAAKMGANAIVINGYARDNSFFDDKMNITATAILIQHNIIDNTQKTITNNKEEVNDDCLFALGQVIAFEDSGRKCVGIIVENDTKKKRVILEYPHPTKKNIKVKTKRRYSELYKYLK